MPVKMENMRETVFLRGTRMMLIFVLSRNSLGGIELLDKHISIW